MAKLTIVNPIATRELESPTFPQIPPAKRLTSLDGRVIGLYWNGKPQGDVALAATGEALQRVFPQARFVDYFADKGAITRFASVGLGAAMAEKCDAVIATTAD